MILSSSSKSQFEQNKTTVDIFTGRSLEILHVIKSRTSRGETNHVKYSHFPC